MQQKDRKDGEIQAEFLKKWGTHLGRTWELLGEALGLIQFIIKTDLWKEV